MQDDFKNTLRKKKVQLQARKRKRGGGRAAGRGPRPKDRNVPGKRDFVREYSKKGKLHQEKGKVKKNNARGTNKTWKKKRDWLH